MLVEMNERIVHCVSIEISAERLLKRVVICGRYSRVCEVITSFFFLITRHFHQHSNIIMVLFLKKYNTSNNNILIWIFLLRHKSSAFEIFDNFILKKHNVILTIMYITHQYPKFYMRPVVFFKIVPTGRNKMIIQLFILYFYKNTSIAKRS